ncbi:MAG: sulfatase-like hydrolase/transferase, partial [Planctomycetales bacterium]|nr:sulfatase-like hydrolase/transferase [Planctomycetales bacterium]
DGPLSADTQRDIGLPPYAKTIAEVLHAADYATACFGKWHLGFRSPFLPTVQGFDTFRGLSAGDGDHHSHIDRYGNEDWWRDNKIDMEVGYTTDLLTKHSVSYIEQHRDRPFFLYVPHLAIHFPWQGPTDPAHRVKGIDYKLDKWGVIPDHNNVHPHVKAMVEAVDTSTGKILETLRRLNLRERTVVIFTSDNGGYLNYGSTFHNISSNGALRGQKGTLYEGGHRVPMIVSWAGSISSSTTDELVHSNDLLPTIAAIAGVDFSEVKSDGVDLSQYLIAGKPVTKRTLFWRAGGDWAVRQGRWKLVSEEGNVELFDLGRDLGEQDSLAARHPQTVARLQRDWHAWNDDMPK